MERNKIIKSLGIGMFVMASLISCNDMSDIYKIYVKGGERIYIGIADSMSVTPGNSKALIEWKLDNDPKLKETIIKWNDTDSVIVPIDNPGEQWQKTIVSNLPEGSVVFTAYTRDLYENVSLSTEKTQEIYGSKYISNLGPRKIAAMEALTDDQVLIEWNSMDNCVGVNLYYKDKEGQEINRFVAHDEMETTLDEVQLGSEFYYTTLYKPTEECLDVFESNPYYMKFPLGYKLDSEGWEAKASSDASSKNDGGDASVLIDGSFDTYWHSSWGSPDAPLPHWILLDMRGMYDITAISIFKKLQSTYCKTIEIYYSNKNEDNIENDDESFVFIGKIEYMKTDEPNGLELVIDNPLEARYIKCVVTESFTPPYACLSEIKVSGIPR